MNMNAHPRIDGRESGFSLIELMVALVLGLILMGGVISVFITSKSTYSLNNALGAVQESGRFALGLMAPNIRMAGFMGCASLTNGATYYTLKDIPPDLFNFSEPVMGYDAKSTGVGGSYTMPGTVAADTAATDWAPNPATNPGIPSALMTSANPPVQGSDMFVLHEASGLGFYLQPNGSGKYTDSANIYLQPSDADTLQQGQIIIVSDCSKTTVSQVTNSPSGGSNDGHVEHSNSGSYVPGNDHPIWPQSYGKGAQLYVAESYVYYIGVGRDLGPSLYMANLGVSGGNTAGLGTPVELVSGVENMQVLYGVDTDGDKIPNVFVPADVVYANNDWGNVVSLRIAVVTQSDDNSVDKTPATAATYTLLDASAAYGVTLTAPKDRRLRRVFQETISIRNKLP